MMLMMRKDDTLCHELRNTLNGIQGNAEILRIDQADFAVRLKSATDAELPALKTEWLKQLAQTEEAIQAIEICVEQQRALIDARLQFSKLEAGKTELNLKNFTPGKVVLDVIAMSDREIKAKGLQLQTNFLQVDKVVNGDPVKLTQVLRNLLSNAIKFTPEKGKLTLNVRQPKETKEQTTLQFEVKDTGIGMSAEEKSRIFNHFAQANKHIEAEYGGSGLGLAISKNLVELMGGKISVESEKWHGTCFTFTIVCKNCASDEVSVATKVFSEPIGARKLSF